MKRAAIVTACWFFYSWLAWYTEVGILVFLWTPSVLLMFIMWAVVLCRWVLGGKRKPAPTVGFHDAPPPNEPREQFSITGRRLR